MAQPESQKEQLRTKLRWIVLPGFICSAAATYYFGQSFLRAFSAGYHPYSDGANFAPLRMQIAFWGAVGFIVIWLVHMVLARKAGPVVRYGSLFVWGVGLLVALQIGKQSVPPQPDAYKKVVGNVTYAVPRHFAPSCGQLNGDIACGTYCWTTGKASYAAACPKEEGMPIRVSVQLASGHLADTWDMSYPLKSAGIVHEGDQVVSFGDESKIKQFSVNDLTGLSLENGRTIYYIDETKHIVAVVEERANGPWHTITQRTPDGVLRYDTRSVGMPTPNSWAEHSKKPRQLINSWRCNEPTCGGQFTE